MFRVIDVPEASFRDISQKRDHGSLLMSLRFTYYSSSELLVIKIPGSLHELTHTSLSKAIGFELQSLGVDMYEYGWVGATRFAGGPNSSRNKKAD